MRKYLYRAGGCAKLFNLSGRQLGNPYPEALEFCISFDPAISRPEMPRKERPCLGIKI